MIPLLPNLKILPLEILILHEEHDHQRTQPLVRQMRSAGILRNPPIVMPLIDGTNRYMVLDGANRVTSLRELEFPHIVAQLVEAQNSQVNLQTWNHVVWGLSPKTLLNRLGKIKELDVVKIDTLRSLDAPKYVPVQIRLPDGKFYILAESPCDLHSHIDNLHRS